MDILDIIPFEDEFANKSIVDSNTRDDSVINLISHKK